MFEFVCYKCAVTSTKHQLFACLKGTGYFYLVAITDARWSLSPPDGHRYETTSSDDSSSEDSSSSGSDEEEEEEEKRWEDKEDLKDVERESTGEGFQPEGVEDVDKNENECSEKQGMRERWGKKILNESCC